MNDSQRLVGWTPFRVAFRGDAGRRDSLWVDWCHLGARRMVEPFHFETIVEAMREPFNLAFQQSTPIEALDALPRGVPVAGLVFHMSRCGSTLISQALAALDTTIVLSEATPLRILLRAVAVGRASPAQAAIWLRRLVNAYAQPRLPGEARLFIKFMAADVLDLALVRRAFGDVPWIFVTRDPAEILASQNRMGGIDLMRGQIPPSRLGLTEDTMWRMDPVAYKAHVLACLAEAGLAAHAGGRGLILDHTELPEALWTKVPAHFGLSLDPEDVERMRAVSRRHSKRPGDPFSPDHDPSRLDAAAFRPVAEASTGRVMDALAALRRVA